MKKTILITLFVLTLALLSAGGYNEYYFNFKIRDYADLSRLGEIVSIDKIEGFMVYAYANDDEWAEFQKTNYNAHLLPHPGINPDAKMAESKAQMREWDAYPTYQAYVDMMYGFAQDYPDLCRIVDAGTTVGGRKILFAVISDNVSQREAEPRLMYTSTMHGDETVGYILMLRLIDTLLSGYGDDPRLTNLVNNGELWINPNANPDGTYYGGNNTVSSSRRYNQNGYDLNRNYPSPTGSQYAGQPLQTETSLMMTLGLQERFHLVANFHGGAEVVNYPWDHKYDLHVDDAWYQTISREYATSAQNHGPAGYMDDLENGITNGASWYVTTGNRQDWTNYAARGREVTIEVSTTKNPAASTLLGFWNYNYDALLGFLEQGTYGIHGSVKDAWGNPLSATITVMNHDDELSTVQSIPTSGTYFRYLVPGEYSLRVFTPGYEDIIIDNVVVSSGVSTLVETIFGSVPSILEIPLETGW
ncbi:MAG TPA: M14 family zinc carboxypeptidase, partial [Candidatus Cloacimonadota bacterium]|nr:M14 family zinc carboxypeptidase [Candidatus Cloacimonadota bacterium]